MLKKSMFILIMVVMVLNYSIPATASTNLGSMEDNDTPEEKMMSQAESFDQVFDDHELKKWTKRAEQQVKLDRLTFHNEQLDFENAKLFEVKDTQYKTVVVPMIGDDYHEISTVSIYFEKPNKIKTYTELHLKRSEYNTFQMVLYVDGEEVTNKISSDTFTTAENAPQSEESSNGTVSTMGVDWNGFLDCMGITGITARWLSYVCGATCVITLGTACVVCAAGFLGVQGGITSACLSDNWD